MQEIGRLGHGCIEKQGDVDIQRIREVRPSANDFMLIEFDCYCLGADSFVPMLFGDEEIKIKFWKDEEGNGKPTIIETHLKWETFDMDDNILVMVKKSGMGSMQLVTILVTKKYQ